MSLWVVIPVKPLDEAKTRLAAVLSPQARATLAEAMLRHTLSVVSAIPQVEGTLVVSRDAEVLALARGMGARTLSERAPGLNNSLSQATERLISLGASAVMILPADMPLINPPDLGEVIRLGQRDNVTVLVTDSQGDGTNVMLVSPPGLFDYAYGRASFRKHRELAARAGATVRVYESERLSLDIDTPDDLEAYRHYAAQHDLPFVSLPDNVQACSGD